MAKEYERVNEPLFEKLGRAATHYEQRRLCIHFGPSYVTSCHDCNNVARQLREIADRIRRVHAEVRKVA